MSVGGRRKLLVVMLAVVLAATTGVAAYVLSNPPKQMLAGGPAAQLRIVANPGQTYYLYRYNSGAGDRAPNCRFDALEGGASVRVSALPWWRLVLRRPPGEITHGDRSFEMAYFVEVDNRQTLTISCEDADILLTS